jgi:hypothetical protein
MGNGSWVNLIQPAEPHRVRNGEHRRVGFGTFHQLMTASMVQVTAGMVHVTNLTTLAPGLFRSTSLEYVLVN